jgi:hypothetical protein
MGAFLRDEEGAKEVWDEAEEALATFETWRKGLRLNEMDGELGELGRLLDATEGERSREAGLKQVVFEGPQVRLSPLYIDVLLSIIFASRNLLFFRPSFPHPFLPY